MSKFISPILKNKIENKTNFDNAYQNLKSHASDVKPNEPKARLVKQDFIQKITDPIADTFQDGKNFFKASRTGKLNDNNLGRINDVGMKAGALLIASFLASRAKTKTNAIMQFIGGTTFFASMSLWPKLFINLPARLVHGFRIDHKYISAQGDKKELGLDNQFQPMDIFSDEEMMKMAKKAGINPDDAHAREKMQRKLQKTMLQNRTLWMATAGFATPLMTSLIGNAVEPKVRNAVIKHQYNKTKNIVSDEIRLDEYLNNAEKSKKIKLPFIKKAPKETNLSILLDKSANGAINKETYEEIAKEFDINKIFKSFKDTDDIKPIKMLKSNDIIPVLQEMREEASVTTPENLKEAIKGIRSFTPVQTDGKTVMKIAKEISADCSIENIKAVLKNNGAIINDDTAKEIAEQFTPKNAQTIITKVLNKSNRVDNTFSLIKLRLNKDYSLKNVRRVLKASSRFTDENIEEILTSIRADNSKFVENIKEYETSILPAMKERIKAYMKLVNSVVGQKEESVYTKEYIDTMNKLFKSLDIKDEELKAISKGKISDIDTFLSEKMQESIAKKDYIKTFAPKPANGVYDASLSNSNPDALKEAIKNELQNKETYKEKLVEIFGKNSELAKEGDEMNNFLAHISPDNDDWINWIVKDLNDKEKVEKIAEIKKFAKEIQTKREPIIEQISKYTKGGIKGQDAQNCLRNLIYPKGEAAIAELKSSPTLRDFAEVTRQAGVEDVIDELAKQESMEHVLKQADDFDKLSEAIIGGKDEKTSLFNQLKEFILLQRTNLSATKVKGIILANFEARCKSGEFKDIDEDILQAARKLITDGNISQWYNSANLYDKLTFENLVKEVYNPEAFLKEEAACGGIKAVVKQLADTVNNDGKRFTEKYLGTGSFSELVKNHATRLYENKEWMKIFAPMAAALVAVTLLVQPLFGKIDKEFPENDKKGVQA